MRILAVGDSYLPAAVFEKAFEDLAATHDVEYVQLDETRELVPATGSERRIREFAGTPDQLVERMNGVEVLVIHGAPVTDEVLAASSLRLVCCARGGPVNVDLEAASARGIPVVTTPGKNADAVADQTLAFLVMLARRFPSAQRFLLEGNRVGESAFEGAEFFGHDLRGHVLGLVGYGNVGRRVARRALSFGMEVVVYDPYLELEGDEGVEQVASLDVLIRRADFVSLHARATPENENLFGPAEFAAMKPGSYFVNTAREALVDEDALDASLASGHLAGAALDVIRTRAGAGPHPLLRHENVVLTPHIGGATHETLLTGASMLAEEIGRFSSGDPLVNVVNSGVTAS
jgi:D-3-phosphoglycerate dehydrogenase / 2-oxoglutarate reductase